MITELVTAIRPARRPDWSAIEQLLFDNDLPLDGAFDHLHEFVVAEVDGEVVGCAALERYGRAALLRSVAVAGRVRGEGIGRQLVEKLLAFAAHHPIHTIALLTLTADQWFTRFGFIAVPHTALPSELQHSEELRGACPSTAVAMVLRA